MNKHNIYIDIIVYTYHIYVYMICVYTYTCTYTYTYTHIHIYIYIYIYIYICSTVVPSVSIVFRFAVLALESVLVPHPWFGTTLVLLHPVSVRRFPSFRTQPLENLTPLHMNKWISEQPSPWRKIL